MEKIDKLHIMDKVLRELEDLVNSETALLKKLGQIEADNMNVGNKELEQELPNIYEHVDNALTESTNLLSSYSATREKFVKDNDLEAIIANANIAPGSL